MSLDAERSYLLSRRFFMLGIGKLIATTALAGRLSYLQISQHKKYKTLSDGNRIHTDLMPPIRGRILDRLGTVYAKSIKYYELSMVRNQVKDVDDTLERISKIFPINETELGKIKKDLQSKPRFVPVRIKDRLKWGDVLKFESNAYAFPGLSISENYNRIYPLNHQACHLVGYVAYAAEDEKNRSDDLVGLRKGKSGTEYAKQDILVGTPGIRHIEVDARGREIRELEKNPPIHGQDIQLTFDGRLQSEVESILRNHKSACAVVMDVHSGHIKAMASYPSFDPNIFPDILTPQNWAKIQKNPYAPMTNKVLIGQYSPASTFKMVTALAALEHKVISPYQTIHCPGYHQVGNRKFHCWRKHGHGSKNMMQAIAESCDVYFYQVALKVGIEKIAAMANRLGLGVPTGIDLVGEKQGFVPTKSWKKGRFNKSWTLGDTVNASIGQGFMLTTPLQLAVMTARMCNGGRTVQPIITLDNTASSSASTSLGISRANLNIILKGMNGACNWGTGTIRNNRIETPGFEMGGKTGTSQVKGISKRERESGIIKQEDLAWKKRDHALFVGYAPVHKPKYATCVIVEHGGWGGRAAAPVAKEILYQAQLLKA